MSWGNHWDVYGQAWSENVNKFNTIPDEIVIVSDKEIDTSLIKITDNVKIFVSSVPDGLKPHTYYRNLAIEKSSSDWIVPSDLDDTPLPNYIDNLDDDSDIHGFSFLVGYSGKKHYPDQNSLFDRVNWTPNKNNLIPGTSAMKAEIFKKIRYENNVHEDQVLYSAAQALNLKVGTDKNIRFVYSAWHGDDEDLRNTTKIYRDMFLGNRTLFACWFSDTMTENRSKSLDILSKTCNVDLKLITKENFYSYQNDKIPIHKGFSFLSDVHKSDYARTYLMYFYGGGYSDIKANSFDWNPYFDELLTSRQDAIGYSEKSFSGVANFWKNDKNLESQVASNYFKFAGNGHFIFKPRTKFAYDWLTSVHKVMDESYEQLKSNPGLHPYSINNGFHRGYHGDTVLELINNYPLDWTTIGGTIRHRLEYENGLDVFIKGMPFPNMNNYR